MPTPTSRSKILPARGTKANLDAALVAGDLLEGELCYAKDEDALYQVEGGVLIKAGGGLQAGDNVSELVNNAGYITLAQVPADAVTSVNSQTGDVVLGAGDVGAATAAQGALADSAIQPGDNVSTLTNDAGYITLAEVPADAVTSVASKTGDVTLVKADITDFNEADYATAAQGATADAALQAINPAPVDISATPAFDSGTGTQGDPFIISPLRVAPAGQSGVSAQEITIASSLGDLAVFTDNSVGADTRFAQPVGVVKSDGSWTGRLVYNDVPSSTGDTFYTGDLQIGTTYFRWVIEQDLLDYRAPDVGSVAISDVTGGDRFTSSAFPTVVTMTDEGIPASTKGMKAYVEGTLNVYGVTSAITQVNTVAGSWSTTAAPNAYTEFINLSYANNRWFITGVKIGEAWVWTATDPTGPWSGQQLPWPSGTFDSDLVQGAVVRWSGDRYYVSGDTTQSGTKRPVVWYSFNGTSWTATMDPTTFTGWARQVIWDGTQLVCLGARAASVTPSVYTSSNWGSTWTNVGNIPGPSATYFSYWLDYQNGTYFARNSNHVYTSTNLSTWTLRRSNSSWFGIVNGIAVSADTSTGNISYSTNDGVTWTDTGSGGNGAYYTEVVYFGGNYYSFIKGGGTTQIAAKKSADLDTWTANAVSSGQYGTSTYGQAVATDGTVIATLGSSGTNGSGTFNVITTTSAGHSSIQLELTDNTDLSLFQAGDNVTEIGNGDEATGSIAEVDSVSTPPTITFLGTSGTWDVGSQVKGPVRSAAGSRLYTVLDNAGNVSDMQQTDPGFVTQSSTPTVLTFPATLPTGNPPDTEFPAGTTLTVEVNATNQEGTDSATSNTITPA